MSYKSEKNEVSKLTECVCCGKSNLKQILDFGNQPLANSYHKEGEVLPKYPLGLNLCTNCYHLQLTHAVDPDLMFKDYLYVSGTSKTMREYFKWFVEFVCEEMGYRSNLSILDIGCNDGTLLDEFKRIGYDTYGIDPAENLYAETSKRHDITCDYFREGSYNKKFDIIIAQNVFAHGSEPLKFLKACESIMHDDSVLYIQTSQANLILNNEFDSIYHEHVSFFNVQSMDQLVRRTSELYLNDVLKTSIHGISYLFKISKKPDVQRKNMAVDVERQQGLMSLETYDKYQANAQLIITDFNDMIERYREIHDFQIVGYGAAAKGMTFLNACNAKMDYVIDDNPLKQGLYTPAGSSPIRSCDELSLVPDDVKILFVPLAWNYFDEIQSRIKSVRNNPNDRYLKYFPKVTVT